ncbi:MAG TPA: Sec-independent protein translocase protein TatB [Azospirillaceae bacterium]|nr:Sec-independent protein translocase protein TatB [Azospirillaceae bacterium]
MFDIGWPELVVIAVVALVVIGPKDLPKALYSVGKWVRKARLMARDFQGHIDEMMREAELDDLRKQAQQVRNFNVQDQIAKAVDPDNFIGGALSVDEFSDAPRPFEDPAAKPRPSTPLPPTDTPAAVPPPAATHATVVPTPPVTPTSQSAVPPAKPEERA